MRCGVSLYLLRPLRDQAASRKVGGDQLDVSGISDPNLVYNMVSLLLQSNLIASPQHNTICCSLASSLPRGKEADGDHEGSSSLQPACIHRISMDISNPHPFVWPFNYIEYPVY